MKKPRRRREKRKKTKEENSFRSISTTVKNKRKRTQKNKTLRGTVEEEVSVKKKNW